MAIGSYVQTPRWKNCKFCGAEYVAFWRQVLCFSCRAELKRYRRNLPENQVKRRAAVALRRELRAGRIVRQACEKCGNQRSHAHHDDYSQPLEVQWLCSRCHVQRHEQIAKGRGYIFNVAIECRPAL